MKEYMVIANPVAAHGKAIRSIPEVERQLTIHGLDFDLVQTEHAGHASELACQAALSGYKTIVAAGGDGTVNEVLNGLMKARDSRKKPALGVLCIGRGNDFSAGVGIPADLSAGCRVLKENYRRAIDIGRVVGGKYPQGRYFANCVGVGFDAVGTIEVNKLPRWGGFLSFLIAVLKTIFLYYKGPVVRIDYDKQTLTTPTLMVSIMNGRRLGSGFQMAPNSQPDDGYFDMCISHQVSRGRIFTLIPHFIKGTQGTQPEIQTLRAAKVAITAIEGTLPAQTDGEILCVDGTHLEIELLPRQIEIICPKETGA